MGRTLRIETAEVFEPLLQPSRYKGAHGGRGSGKSHFFAEKLIDDSLYHKGLRSVCIREVQKDLKDSAYRLIRDKLAKFGLGESDGFRAYESEIRTPGDGLIIFKGMNHFSTGAGTAESIKSLEGFGRAWVEEAQTFSKPSMALLRPTIRDDGSELWFSWNPRRKSDAVDTMLRPADPENLPTGAVVVEANWRDNPWFPKVLEDERRDCMRTEPDQYDHIWEGGYATILQGAYYAQAIAQAKREGRIGKVGMDPLMTIRAAWDIGGTGAKADATSIWVHQNVGREIRVLNYYEAVGQPLATHINWLRDNGYEKALCLLPHDGEQGDKVIKISYESALRSAGFNCRIIENMGAGAAMARVRAGRRLFPSIWFNADTTQSGLDALGWYHEKWDESRNVGLGPEHDWSSHGADAFGLLCVAYELPAAAKQKPIEYPKQYSRGIV